MTIVRITWKPKDMSSVTHVGQLKEVESGKYHLHRRSGGYWQFRAENIVKMEVLREAWTKEETGG